MNDKFLIINADDLGYNEQQNSAIIELYSAGLISSTSVLTVAPEFKNGTELLREKNLPAGVHLTINSDSANAPWKSMTGDKSLGKNGTLFNKSSDITKHGKHHAVRSELEAQYNALKNQGIEVDHADNHSGTLYGLNLRRFYNDAYDFCTEHNLPYRFPKTPFFVERQLGRKVPKPVLMLHSHIVALGEKAGVRMLDDLVSNPYSINKIKGYDELRQYYLDAVDNCCCGITEMFLHPAHPADDCGPEWQKRVYELELLKSGDILSRAKQKGVKVVSWQIFSELK